MPSDENVLNPNCNHNPMAPHSCTRMSFFDVFRKTLKPSVLLGITLNENFHGALISCTNSMSDKTFFFQVAVPNAVSQSNSKKFDQKYPAN